MGAIKAESDEAEEFNRSKGITPDVAELDALAPFISDELEQTRRLVAKAKGKTYQDWS